MEALGSLLPKALHKHVTRGNQPVVQILVPLWPRIVGKYIARFSQPTAFDSGTLRVAVSSPTWAAELRRLSDEIRAQINGALGAPVVKRLRVSERRLHHGEIGSLVSPERVPGRAGAQESDPSLRVDLAKLLWSDGGVKLPRELAEIVERSFVKYFSRARERTSV